MVGALGAEALAECDVRSQEHCLPGGWQKCSGRMNADLSGRMNADLSGRMSEWP